MRQETWPPTEGASAASTEGIWWHSSEWAWENEVGQTQYGGSRCQTAPSATTQTAPCIPTVGSERDAEEWCDWALYQWVGLSYCAGAEKRWDNAFLCRLSATKWSCPHGCLPNASGGWVDWSYWVGKGLEHQQRVDLQHLVKEYADVLQSEPRRSHVLKAVSPNPMW